MRPKTVMAGAAMALALAMSAGAQEVPPAMDVEGVDPDMIAAFYGPWQIRDESGARVCDVVLKPEPMIGGSQIEIDPACETVFPVMGEIAAWRLLDGWGIALVDALRETRIVFTTPDETYLAEPGTDGIFTIEQQ